MTAAPVRINEPPRMERDRRALRKECRRTADRLHRGKPRKVRELEAERMYQEAVAEAGRRVRDPATQPFLIAPPPSLPHPTAPRGMAQRESGLYVPA